MRFIALVFVIVIASFATKADEGAISDAKKVIESQIEAFLADDSERAYSFAAPSIRQIFPDPDVFIGMVRRGYTPVYRPGAYDFGESKFDGNTIQQRVFITDQNGKLFEAEYLLAKQADGSWKIAGVFLKEAEGLSS